MATKKKARKRAKPRKKATRKKAKPRKKAKRGKKAKPGRAKGRFGSIQRRGAPSLWNADDKKHYRESYDAGTVESEAARHAACKRLTESHRICKELDGLTNKTGEEQRAQVAAIANYAKLIDKIGLLKVGDGDEPDEFGL